MDNQLPRLGYRGRYPAQRIVAQYHLDNLAHALGQKGWAISSTRSLDDHPYDFHCWTIHRGETTLEIQFDRFDPMGRDVEQIQTTGCKIANANHVRLYFGRRSHWDAALNRFMEQLDALSASKPDTKT